MKIHHVAAIAFALASCAPQNTQIVKPRVNADSLRPVLGPSDVVEIRVFGEEELSGEHRISPEGMVRMPLIGAIKLDGKTPEAAAEMIESKYEKDFLHNAQITLNVKEFNSRKIYVLGEVKQPGSYPYEEDMTVIAAIARAGGVGELADLKKAVVTRDEESGWLEKEGKDVTNQKRLTVNVEDIRRGRKSDVNILPGDIIFIPKVWF